MNSNSVVCYLTSPFVHERGAIKVDFEMSTAVNTILALLANTCLHLLKYTNAMMFCQLGVQPHYKCKNVVVLALPVFLTLIMAAFIVPYIAA